MRNNSQDETIKRNYLQKYRFLISEYELVKAKQHPTFRTAQEFYTFHDTDRRSFRKYYNRYKQSGREEDLLPQKRGPRWKTRRALPEVEEEVKRLRAKGMNRHEITHVLKPKLGDTTPYPAIRGESSQLNRVCHIIEPCPLGRSVDIVVPTRSQNGMRLESSVCQ